MKTTHMSRELRGPALQTAGLTKRFGDRTAVDDVSIEVPRGVAYGFLGHNGAGKTTLIRMLLGLTGVSAGSVSVLGLDKRSGDRVGKYSLGMRQRLGVARCLLSEPELLILDEPMNGLDPGGMLDMRRMIRSLVEDEGRTVFISSHLLDEVEKTCDRAAIIDGGRMIAQGPIDELIADEINARLVGAGCERSVAARAAAWVALPITVGVIVNTGTNPGVE